MQITKNQNEINILLTKHKKPPQNETARSVNPNLVQNVPYAKTSVLRKIEIKKPTRSVIEIERSLDRIVEGGLEIKRDRILEAEKIGYKNEQTRKIKFDQYGFEKEKTITSKAKNMSVIQPMKYTEDDYDRYFSQQNERILKWTEMLEHFDYFYNSKLSKLKERTRKGIPDAIRGAAWMKLARVREVMNQNQGLYERLVANIKNYSKEDFNENKDEDVIIRDLHRTFPNNVYFKDKLGQGQRALYKVLLAYSTYNTKTGYVQGMGFPVALFLTYLDEEQSFYLFMQLMSKYELEASFYPNFPGIQKKFCVFLNLQKRFFPKIYKLFIDNKVSPTMYAAQWFFTYFSNIFKFEILTRIFDCLLLEGVKIIYRISLALIKLKEEKLLACKEMEEIMMELKDIVSDDIDVEELLKIAFGFSLSRKDIKKYEDFYENNKENKEDEIIQLCVF